jgi:CelD/BcsL family acetyltransferase involved in cellulose biosynthesis
MSIAVVDIREASASEWDDAWDSCEYATYFQSREWARFWSAYTDGTMRPAAKVVRFSDHTEALLPFSSSSRHKGLVRDYFSSPAGTFGGWLAGSDFNAAHAQALSALLTTRWNLVWRLNPYDALALKSYQQGGRPDETHALPLEHGFNFIEKTWSKERAATGRNIRKARKEGVRIKLAGSAQQWREYYAVYEESSRRWADRASSRYEWKLFEEMLRCDTPRIKLWTAVVEDRLVAGALCFYGQGQVVYWHGAALEAYFHVRPVNLLFCEAIKDACETGYRWFDFNPSGGHEGVKAFKQSFGAVSLQCPVISIETRWSVIAGKIAREMRKVVS